MYASLYNAFIWAMGTSFGLIIVGGLFAVVVLLIVGQYKFFEKCGQAGWKSLIPFYSVYVFCNDICGLNLVYSIVAICLHLMNNAEGVFGKICGFVVIFIYALAFYNLAEKTNKDRVPTAILGAIFENLVMSIFGFSNDFFYDVETEVDPNSFLASYLSK